MKMTRAKIKWSEYVSVLRNEYLYIFKDPGIILIMMLAIFIYSILYSFAYKNEVLLNVPIAVVDNSKSSMSRKLISDLDATPNINVSYVSPSMDDARELFFSRDINGIVYIPKDYEKNLLSGGNTILGLYVDASNFLMYRQVFEQAAKVLLTNGAEVEYVRLISSGVAPGQAKTFIQPVAYQNNNLFNPYLGYGTFLMPAILIMIIQQTLIIGIGMIGGTWREFGTYRKLIPLGEKRLSTMPIVLGKSTAYLSIYAVTVPIILGFIFPLFGFAQPGRAIDMIVFMFPYLLSIIFLGIALSTLFRHRENSIMFLLWTSIPMLLLTGASIPKEGIPTWMYVFGKIFPSSTGVEGFLRIHTMGATIMDVSREFTWLWILTGVYFVAACVGMRVLLRRDDI